MRRAASALALTALSACTVGPAYEGPPAVPRTLSGDLDFVRAVGFDQVGASSSAPWWLALGDPVLDDIMARALEHGLTVEAAGTAPVVQAGAAAARGEAPGIIGQTAALFQPEKAGDPDSTDLYAAGFDAL